MNSAHWTVRRLVPDDAAACVAIRQEMLVEAADAFLASPDADRGSDLELVRSRLAEAPGNVTFGAFTDGIVGAVGVVRPWHEKASHRVELWGMYVTPALRRQGVGRRLLEAAIEHARGLGGITQINLGVSETAGDARALYESMGFREWGTEPHAMRDGGRLLAIHHMVLPLRD